MYTIQLHQLVFYASHGIYHEEKKLLSPFQIDLDIHLNPPNKIIKGIADTIDYATVHGMLKVKMAIPADLLETLCEEIADQIAGMSASVTSIQIRICKLNPDIPGFMGKVCVSFEKKYQ